MTRFQQKYRGHKTSYSFDDKSVSYVYADSEDTISFSVKYNEIDLENAISQTSKNPIWKFASIPFILLALFAITKTSISADSQLHIQAGLLVTLMWMLIAGAFWIKYQRSLVSLTLFNSARGRLVVVHDGQEEKIIGMMKKLLMNNLSSLEPQEGRNIQ